MSESDRPAGIDPDGTEMVDLGDADVSAVDFESQRSLPPPLPSEVRASAAAPAPPASPAPQSSRFYVMLLFAFLAVGIIAGIAIAIGTRGEKKPAAAASASVPSAAGASSVMMLPTIDMTDETDGGN